MAAVRMLLVAVVIGLLAAACGEGESFQGTVLNAEKSPDFQLRDQNNQMVSLSDYQGKIVALTFLYTYCPDVCPVVTESIRRALDVLGEEASGVEFLAISVDPYRDNIDTAQTYSQDRGLDGRWRFLVGTQSELEPVWNAYWLDPISPRTLESQVSHVHEDGEVHEHDVAGGQLASPQGATDPDETDEGYLVRHSAPIFLIDREGYRRVLLNNLTLDPMSLVHDIRLLMNN